MTEPKPVKVEEALRLIEMALEDEGRSTDYWEDIELYKGDLAFAALCSATMRPILEAIRGSLRLSIHDPIMPGAGLYQALAAFADHYDQVTPEWRTK